MYKEKEQLKTDIKCNDLGKERLLLTDLTDFAAINPKIKFFSSIVLKPGEEVMYHMHVGESEMYYILSGKGMYNDNGTQVEVSQGAVTLTPSGEGHSLKNTGEEDLAFIGLILFD